MQTAPLVIRMFVAFSALAASVRAENSTPTLRANVDQVDDYRTTTGTRTSCRLTLTLLGDATTDFTGSLRIRLLKATDDLDRDLVPKSNSTFDRYASAFSRVPSMPNMALHGSITLKNPSRRAETIKLIEAVAELYSPTETNHGIVEIPDALAKPGVSYANPVLEKYGIELTYITEDAAAELRKTTPSDGPLSVQDELVRLNAVAAEVARRREIRELDAGNQSPSSPPAILPPSRATLTTPVPVPNSSPASRLTIQVKDPNNKLVELEWRDVRGKTLRTRSNLNYGPIRTVTLTDAPPKDAQLVAYVATAEAVKEYSLKLENVALP
jgi:hypothetical protein